MTRITAWIQTFAAAALLAGCASIEHAPSLKFSCTEKWVVLPMSNYSEAPHAGKAAEKLVENVLLSRGLPDLFANPGQEEGAEYNSIQKQYDKALDWARGQNARYGVTGAVTEWRYKSGVDGEPAVGMTLQIVDVESAKVIWSAGGAKSGWSRDALSGVAQDLIRDLLKSASISCRG
ncbi:MAG: penicillin-binding protein activator LpoB [Fibrobacteria bacterium]